MRTIMNSKNRNKISESFSRRLLKYLLTLVVIFVLLVSTAFILFSIYKDDISKTLILKINDMQRGEITLEDISLTPFKYFPDISLQLERVNYYKDKAPARPDTIKPIISLNSIYIALDILDLISGRFNINELSIQRGTINIISQEDGSINIISALGLSDTSDIDESVEKEKSDFSLSAEKIELIDIITQLENKANGNSIEFKINTLDASLAVVGQQKHIVLDTDITLLSIMLNSDKILNDKSIQMKTDIFFDNKELLLKVKPSRFVFEGAEFDFSGTFDIKNDGNLDLTIAGSDKDFSFFSMVLREDTILKNRKNLKEGDIYFNGVIQGKVFAGIPFAEFTFGLNNVSLDLPVMKSSINNLTLSGYFTTGGKQDLSEAIFSIDYLSAELPDGYTEGSVKITNFLNPYLDLELYLKTDITGYDEIFKIDAVDNLSGIITINEELHGLIDPVQRRIAADTANAEIQFENVSVTFPGEISLDKINGKIQRVDDRYSLEDLHILSGNTDVTINGFVDNILYLLFDIESDVFADLSIKSDRFVFPEVFSFDPSAAESFPYTINNLDLNVEATTSISTLINFDDFPDVDFHIKSMDASFDDLPDIKNLNGDLSIYEDPFSFNIKFDDLSITVADGELELNGLYTGAENLPLYLKSDIRINNIDLLEFLTQFEMELDSTSIFNAALNSSMYVEIQFSREDIVFDTFLIKDCDIEYVRKVDADTIATKNLSLSLKNVNYNLDLDSNPLATFTGTGKLTSAQISAPGFLLKDTAHDISVANGSYTIIPLNASMFGQKGEGKFELRPWADIPEYNLTYEVKQFDIENLLTTFMEDTVLTGKIDLSFNVSIKGDDWENMLSELEGDINLTGNDLTMYGLDVDLLLKRIARSQNFNLVDVSAVLLAGPVGLAITKGTDLASIVIISPGEKTDIPEIVSVWNMHDGNLDMTDVAFTTNNHRIAAKGFINLAEKNLNVTIAEVNKDGCIILSQDISGNLEDPQTGDIKVLESLLSPVTNLFNSIIGKDCEVFYDGMVKHPK